MRFALKGSSPLTRGALHHKLSAMQCRRIIPAYAGSTRRYTLCSCFALGSSPLTRGALLAYWPLASGLADHPRLRGEHVFSSEIVTISIRIIPAYAGSTAVSPCVYDTYQDHLRLRGEHSEPIIIALDYKGSSPLTRGALQPHARKGYPVGIIPAYAGSTSPFLLRKSRCRDHPRLRGEHRTTSGASSSVSGSSPLTRGARGRDSQDPAELGIIPAYAGSTPAASRPPRGARDHPRLRGEHS